MPRNKRSKNSLKLQDLALKKEQERARRRKRRQLNQEHKKQGHEAGADKSPESRAGFEGAYEWLAALSTALPKMDESEHSGDLTLPNQSDGH